MTRRSGHGHRTDLRRRSLKAGTSSSANISWHACDASFPAPPNHTAWMQHFRDFNHTLPGHHWFWYVSHGLSRSSPMHRHSILPFFSCSGNTFSSSTRGAHCPPMRSHTSGEHHGVNPEQRQRNASHSILTAELPVPVWSQVSAMPSHPMFDARDNPGMIRSPFPPPIPATLSSPTMRPTTAASTSPPAWPGSLAPPPLPPLPLLGLPRLLSGPPLPPETPRKTSSGVMQSPYCSRSPLSMMQQRTTTARNCSSPTARTITGS